jgi:predicted Zn-dependent protease
MTALRRFQSERLATGLAALVAAGCATVTPQYALRPDPVIEDSPVSREIEQTISNAQAQELEQEGARPLRPGERLHGFDVPRIVERLRPVTERPNLNYRVFLMHSDDPNAAALADGRIYVSEGMLKYLGSRGSREDELAFVLGHELAHTVAQHLVKRYRQLQQQQIALAIVGLGTAAVTRGGGEQAQQVGNAIQSVASLAAQAVAMGYSQDQELEADQLGMRYLIRAGYDPKTALAMIEDFRRFDQPGVEFLRTHPYTDRRLEDLRRYLAETGYLPAGAAAATPPMGPGRLMSTASGAPAPSLGGGTRSPSGAVTSTASASASGASARASGSARASRDEQRRRLREAQKLYPQGSQSWKNLQQQLDALK